MFSSDVTIGAGFVGLLEEADENLPPIASRPGSGFEDGVTSSDNCLKFFISLPVLLQLHTSHS